MTIDNQPAHVIAGYEILLPKEPDRKFTFLFSQLLKASSSDEDKNESVIFSKQHLDDG